jgi:hypothetical protein
MDIRGISSGNSNGNGVSRVRGNTTKIDNAAASSGHQHSGGEVSSTSSFETVRLAEELRRLPEVRKEVVTEVSQRLAAGEYETKQAAIEAASAFLEEGFA